MPVPKTYDKGDMIVLNALFYNLAGQLANPSSVALKIIDPLKNQTTVAPVNDSVGTYHYDLDTDLLDLSGIWEYRFESTGTITAAEEGSFYLRYSEFT